MDLFDKTIMEAYDYFNGFMMCNDTKIFGKLVARATLLNTVKNIPGDIVECGVFKGTGMLTFLKLKRIFFPNSIKRVIGFDLFNTNDLVDSLYDNDKKQMSKLFNERQFSHDTGSADYIFNIIKNAGFSEIDFELVIGDITTSAYNFIKARPGFKISMLYMDLDLEQPTFHALNAFWDRVSRGGLIVFDEYAYHKWSESIGVDRFFADKNVTINVLDFLCPTAYVIKD